MPVKPNTGRGFSVLTFKWGTAVRRESDGKFVQLFLYPDAQEINTEHLPVHLSDEGIRFNIKAPILH